MSQVKVPQVAKTTFLLFIQWKLHYLPIQKETLYITLKNKFSKISNTAPTYLLSPCSTLFLPYNGRKSEEKKSHKSQVANSKLYDRRVLGDTPEYQGGMNWTDIVVWMAVWQWYSLPRTHQKEKRSTRKWGTRWQAGSLALRKRPRDLVANSVCFMGGT